MSICICMLVWYPCTMSICICMLVWYQDQRRGAVRGLGIQDTGWHRSPIWNLLHVYLAALNRPAILLFCSSPTDDGPFWPFHCLVPAKQLHLALLHALKENLNYLRFNATPAERPWSFVARVYSLCLEIVIILVYREVIFLLWSIIYKKY